MNILAIDPGSTESAYVIIDSKCRPLEFAKLPNHDLRSLLYRRTDFPESVWMEQIGHYGTGMPAGKTVFDTCVWIGRFLEATGMPDGVAMVKRQTIKAHLCGSAKAKDPNVTQALVDRFVPGATNHGKGTKGEPGFFYGFHQDIWAAYALAVFAADQSTPDVPF